MGNRRQLDETGRRILSYLKTELCLAMPFLGAALDALPPRMDLRTRAVGTDGVQLLFSPHYLMTEFIEYPQLLRRTCLHILFHCLFRHLFSAADYKDSELWDIASDIAAEAMVDSVERESVRRLPSEFREEWYQRLEARCGLLTAEKIYAALREDGISPELREQLEKEFRRCDHSFWERDRRRPPESSAAVRSGESAPEAWGKRAKRVRTEAETFGKRAGSGGESLARLLRFTCRERPLYREFLQRFAVLRETAEIDPDSFDYGFYHYGMQRYGNMPLIEENELRELRRVEELVIAIDTSASCQAVLVREFLEETAALLAQEKSFFRSVQIRILESDERVRKDTVLERPEELQAYAGEFSAHGGAGTDFRPVFHYVEELRRRGELRDLRGLVYFTDGFGIYPEQPTDYETAFVFREDQDFDSREVPVWALRLYLSGKTEERAAAEPGQRK
ncbi:MAG: vWA domain-containing protein [Stomatobaculum sp.]